MKKMVLFVLLAAAAGGILFAQTTPATTTTVTGTLGIHAGRIVVKSGTTIYNTSRLGRLVGFVDGFKDGAQVTMEGYAGPSREGQAERSFVPVKLTLNGKEYDLGPARTSSANTRPNTKTGNTGTMRNNWPQALSMWMRNYLPQAQTMRMRNWAPPARPTPPPQPGRAVPRRR